MTKYVKWALLIIALFFLYSRFISPRLAATA